MIPYWVIYKQISSRLLKSLLFIYLLLPGSHLFSQGNSVISYDQEDGICGQNHITCFVDKSGKLWTGSYSGPAVSTFDGTKWNCVGYKNGVLPFTIQEIFQDGQDNIWLFNSDQGLCMISTEGTSFFKFNSKYLPGIYDYYQSDGQLFLLRRGDFTVFKYDQKLGKFIIDKNQTEQNIGLSGKNLYFMGSGNSLKNGGLVFYSIIKKNNIPLKKFFLYKDNHLSEFNQNRISSKIKSNEVFIYDQNIYYIEDREVILCKSDNSKIILPTTFLGLDRQTIHPKIRAVRAHNFNVKKNELIVVYELAEGHRYLLAEYEMNSGKLLTSLIYHSDYNPHDVCKDQANTYWVATEASMQRILYYQLHLSPSDDNFPSQTWSIVQARDGNMWMSSYGMGLARFDGYRIHPQPPFLAANTRFDDVSIFDKGQMLFNQEGQWISGIGENMSSGLLVFDGVNPPKLKLKGTIGLYLGRNNKNELIRGTAIKGLWILPEKANMEDASQWIKIDSSKGMYLKNVLTALQDKYGRYWMGKSSSGFSIYDSITGKCRNFLKAENPETLGIMSMDQDKEGNLWLGTDDGLYFLKNSESLFENNNISKLAVKISPEIIGSSIVNACKVYNQNTLVIGNLSGYYLLDIDYYYKHAGKSRFNSIFKTDYKNYLGGQVNQNGIAFDRDSNIWIVTSKGVYRHSPSSFVRDTLPASLIIDSMIIGKRKITFNGTRPSIDLAHTERSFTIYFHHQFSPLLYNNVMYRYRLDSTQTWSPLSGQSSINYQNLSPGNYNLQIQAIKRGVGSSISNISFTIDRVIWLKWWFWLGNGALASIILVFLYTKQKRIHTQKLALSQKETEVEIMSKEMDKLHVQAIVNQLNPHFINNALQWLQVRVDDDVEAVKVIGKLSENISTVFKNSRKQINYHSLREEIQLTNNYLFIQKCRFGDRLKIEVPSLDSFANISACLVPIMIVQIHAENAIEHGIRNKEKGEGTVKIEIEDSIENFTISIQDDGVGREKSKLIGSKGTQNGTKMLSEVEKIYNKQNKLKITQEYYDGMFFNTEGSSYGTKVIITIPKQYNYII